MKELSIEEKAKAYDEAIERAESIYNETAIPSATTKGICTYIFPELKESEDERIRKGLIAHLKDLREWEVGKQVPIKTSEHYDAWLTWIEKKSEQKSVEDIAKEVIKDKESAVQFLKSAGIMDSNGELAKEYRDEQNLVESTDDLAPILQGYIPTIMNKHGMPEIEADAITETAYYFYSLGAKKVLKIKCQKSWKPSIAQLTALSIVSKGNTPDDIEAIVSLYNDLKKLREE